MTFRMLLTVCVKCILLLGLVIVNEATDRISVAKCNDYQKLCPLEVPPINFEGEAAASKEFPFMVLLGIKNFYPVPWLCGGSLINEKFVLVTGNCLSSYSSSPEFVRLGDLDYESEDDDAHVLQYNVTNIILHPEFKKGSPYNDIALVEMDRRVEFSQYIQPACLSHPSTNISDRLITTGWGRTSMWGNSHSALQKVPLNLVSHDICNETYASSEKVPYGVSTENHLCAGSNPFERSACAGFSGSPLLNTGRKFSCLYEIVGIISFRRECGLGYPGLFTRIESYLDWIESIVWPVE